MIQFIDDDPQRQVDDQVGGLQLGFGQAVAPYWDFEISLFTANWDGFDETDQHGLNLDAHLLFNPDRSAKFSPYIIMGTGFMNSLKQRAPDSSDMILSLGAGMDWRLTEKVAFRTDARVRRDFSPASMNLDDVIVNAGFRMALGEPAAPPVGDSDGDGVNDDLDRCPNTPMGVAVNSVGCELDSDGDGVADRMDKCPDTRRGASVDSKGCEIVRDSDGDGVADNRDRCPKTPRGAKVDANGCQFDSDGDGVVDRLDRCPDTPAGTRVNSRGCPLQQEFRLEGVFFEFDSAQLRDGAETRLDEAVQTLRMNGDLKIEVAGHTDSIGAASYNQSLSQRRAESVRDYLVAKGIDASRLTAKGYGESQPIASNDTRESRARNRRVMLRILNEDI
ncbi:MAG: OmpA family protein, partial [Gammaproteobacteria bacterium]|nr:OmpA family protein [Gammaproteobacteria bacterium]